jgi:hypothetical protein
MAFGSRTARSTAFGTAPVLYWQRRLGKSLPFSGAFWGYDKKKSSVACEHQIRYCVCMYCTYIPTRQTI